MLKNSWILYNGQWMKEMPLLTSSNRAFLYGDGVFETFLTQGVEMLFAEHHIDRLHQSMNFFKLPIIEDLTKKGIQDRVERLINQNKWFTGARFRLTVFRHSEGRYTPVENKIGYLLEGQPHVAKPIYPIRGTGKLLTIYDDFQKPDFPFYQHKTINSQFYVMAGIYAKESGVDDSFLLNSKHEIIEAVSSNIFLIKGNDVFAPGPKQGALDGTMRKIILPLIADKGFAIHERGVTEAEILAADEILLTNAIQGITYVKGYKDRRYYFRIAEQLSQELNKIVKH